MKIALTFGPQCMAFKGSLLFSNIMDDPRGLTGSEIGIIRVAEEMAALGHDVTLFVDTPDAEWNGVKLRPLAARSEVDASFDAAISWSEPDTLRETNPKLRVLYNMLNGWTHVKPGFDQFFDLGIAVSRPHLNKILHDWHDVGSDAQGQPLANYSADPDKWTIVPLGCDPERLTGGEKVSGKVIYCSSPDRGLHWLLQEWPAIKRAVPHATLNIFYRLKEWADSFDSTPFFPPIEPNRKIALYVRECLRRFAEHGGMGVTLRDSVSRHEIEREMASAEVLAYPCDTMSWSEGFSCSILECCAAKACPIITDCDALGDIYADLTPVQREGDWVPKWRERVIRALTDESFRAEMNQEAAAIGARYTWQKTTEKLLKEIDARRGK